jgi:hypothetical protein
MLTNSRHFIPVSPTARRFFAPTVSEDRVGDFEYFNEIEAQLRDGGAMKPCSTISNAK